MTIDKEILRLALPAIISNITTPLLGLVDTAITGHMGAAAYLAAIAVGGSMFSLTYWIMNFLRMGTSGFTSQAYGAQLANTKDGATSQAYGAQLASTKDGAAPQMTPEGILRFSMIIALAISALLILLSYPICQGLLFFMDADTATTAYAALYYRILIFGAPAVLGTFALTGWFLGMQDSRAPMWMALVTNIANITTSLVLVFGCHLKIEGVAIGTLVAQYMGVGVGLWHASRKYGVRLRRIERHLLAPMLQRQQLKRFFMVNSDIFLRTLCLAAVTLWFTRAGARQGADIVAANAILMQLFILFSYFMDGFAFAGEAMSGKYYGMGDRRMLSLTIRGIFRWGLAVVALFTIAYACGGRLIIDILTDRPEIAQIAMRYMPWAIAVPAAGVAAFVWDGIYIGLTFTRKMLISMAVAMATFFTLYFALFHYMGNHGLWLSFIAYLLLRGIVQTILWQNPLKIR